MSIPQVLMAALFVFPAAETPRETTRTVLPADPFARAATKALRGDFGPLEAWQEAGYRAGLAQGVTATQAVWLTSYYGTEKDGRVDRAGDRCTLRHVAANLWADYWFARPRDSTFGGATGQPVRCAVVRPEGRVAK